MKTLSIITSTILSVIAWGFVLDVFIVSSGNLIIEDGLIAKLPNSYIISTYVHLILMGFIIIYAIKKNNNYKVSIGFLSLFVIPSLIGLIILFLLNSSALSEQKYSLYFSSNWNYTDILFYFALYLKALNFIS